MKLALYLPRYLQAISLPLLGPKILSFFDFLCSVSPYCISILWHKIQSRSFSHPYTSKPPASRSRAVSGVRKCFFIGKWCFCFRGYEVLLGGLSRIVFGLLLDGISGGVGGMLVNHPKPSWFPTVGNLIRDYHLFLVDLEFSFKPIHNNDVLAWNRPGSRLGRKII